MLVPWGLFAQHIGLVEALENVPIPQRQWKYTPQIKLIEFLVSILAGCAYLRISARPSPAGSGPGRRPSLEARELG